MKNNKGFTLTEILVTIILVASVLSSLLYLINIVKKEEINNKNTYNYEINKLKFIREIQNDLNQNDLISISDDILNKALQIKFNYANNNNSLLIVTEDKLSYIKANKEEYTWELKDIKASLCANFIYNKDSNSNNYYYKINIYLDNNDSIEISYSANNSNMQSDYIEKKIGACTN